MKMWNLEIILILFVNRFICIYLYSLMKFTRRKNNIYIYIKKVKNVKKHFGELLRTAISTNDGCHDHCIILVDTVVNRNASTDGPLLLCILDILYGC